MKKKIFYVSISVFVIILIMIFSLLFYYGKNFGRNHRTNHFVEGEFVGINTSDEDEVFYMSVSSISKEEFINSLGINVLQDKYKKTYFKLTLYYQSNEEEKVYIELKNLTAYGTPISYKDDFVIMLHLELEIINQMETHQIITLMSITKIMS